MSPTLRRGAPAARRTVTFAAFMQLSQLLPHHGLLGGNGLPASVQIPEHIGEANRGYRLVVRTGDRIQSADQYSVVKAIDTPLAVVLAQPRRGYRAAREYVTPGSQHALPVGIDEIVGQHAS